MNPQPGAVKQRGMKQSRSYVFRGPLPLGVLLVLPALFFLFASLAVVLVIGGIAGSLALRLLFGRPRQSAEADGEGVITLERDQYRVVASPAELPARDDRGP